ncbi:hypothetical protein MSAN_02048800 [Mycena sanguinolenta]|uniref:Uncharacterized protein n=1 Tax=Mycena sanguinolenta TaxID=230812 RepID=A0A8H6XI30_9AGAR|nr:hypothetical protein MSAN_02048800 [Mycena sanguinolenta]
MNTPRGVPPAGFFYITAHRYREFYMRMRMSRRRRRLPRLLYECFLLCCHPKHIPTLARQLPLPRLVARGPQQLQLQRTTICVSVPDRKALLSPSISAGLLPTRAGGDGDVALIMNSPEAARSTIRGSSRAAVTSTSTPELGGCLS